MFGFFTKPIVSEEELDWQVDTYRWLLNNYGKRFRDGTYKLVKPNKDFFPDECASPEEVFRKTFLRVKGLCGLQDWPCRLEPQEEDPDSALAPTLMVKGTPNSPAGTFREAYRGSAVITFNPGLVYSPESLVATYAHELGHYLTCNCKVAPPGGWECWEHATDLTAIFMGFGIFMVNTAFVFRQFTNAESQGWEARTLGYMSQEERINALCIFVLLQGIDVNEPLPYLKPQLRRTYKKGIKHLKNAECLEVLKNTGNILKLLKL